ILIDACKFCTVFEMSSIDMCYESCIVDVKKSAILVRLREHYGELLSKNLDESINNAGLHDLFQKFGNILSSFGNCFGASNWFRGSDDSDTAEKPRERGKRKLECKVRVSEKLGINF
ncbi:hypothetical protein HN51_069680, partial [Arachis hypogaea]